MDLSSFLKESYQHVPTIKKLFDTAAVSPEEIISIGDLAKLPLTPKERLIEKQKDALPFGGMLSEKSPALKRIFMSPGPIYDPEGRKEDFWRWGSALRTAGFAAGDIVQNTFSYHFTPAGMMFDAGLQALGCTVVPTGVGNNEQQVKVMHDLGVTGFVGIPSYLKALIDKARELGFLFPEDFKLKKAFFTAEMLPTSLRCEFTEMGIETFQGYGTADLGCVAYECGVKKGMHLGKGIIVEIVDPESGRPLPTGEIGEMAVTLLDETYPLIRFATGDLSRFISDSCPCGSDSPRIRGVMGRIGDAVKVRGLFVHGSQIKEVMDLFEEIEKYQAVVVQEGYKDELILQFENKAAGTVTEEQIASALKEKTRLNCSVKRVPLGTIAEGSDVLKDKRSWD